MPRLIALFVSAVIVLSGVATCIPLLRQKAALKKDQLALQKELEEEEARTIELMRKIDAARNDPATVERLARERFGLARPGEVVFKFRGDLPPAPRRP
jgi:cell division protein FtsB